LIPDLQDGVAYVASLNGLLPGKFKFSLAKSKVTTLAKALRKAQSFIQATEICAGDEPLRQENRKRTGENRDAQLDKRLKRSDERGCVSTRALTTSLWKLRGVPCSGGLSPSKRQPSFGARTGIVNTMRIFVIQHQSAGS